MKKVARRDLQGLEKVLSQAADKTEGRVTYVNNVRFNLTVNEVILDMYVTINSPSGDGPVAQLVERIVLPISVAKDLSQIIMNSISEWEDTFGINLPLVPTSKPLSDGQSLQLELPDDE